MTKENKKYLFLGFSIFCFLVFIGCLAWFGVYMNALNVVQFSNTKNISIYGYNINVSLLKNILIHHVVASSILWISFLIISIILFVLFLKELKK